MNMEIAGLTAQFGILAVAVISVIVARNIAQKRATLEFIYQYNQAEKVSLGHQVILKYNGGVRLDELLKKGGEDRENFLFVMNMFELLVIGLNSGIYHRNMIMDAFGEELRGIYRKAEPLILHVRGEDGSGRAFVHIEAFAKKIK